MHGSNIRTLLLCLSYYFLCFLFNKIREQEGRTGSARKPGRGEMAQTTYTHVSKCENGKRRKEKKKKRWVKDEEKHRKVD
jgi:hypothetical protein